MGYNGVFAVYDLGVIPSLVEHAHVHAQVIGKIHGPIHGALVGADDHQVILVDADIGVPLENCLEKLIRRHIIVQAMERDGVGDARIVRVKGNDIFHAHADQLLERERAV